MSTLQVANIHLESTGNNRIQYDGSNTFTIAAGDANVAVINSTAFTINTNTSVGGTLSVNTNATIGGANVVTVSDTQTLTNKTLNAPVINGPVTGNVVLSQATWETGTDTTEALVSPAKVAAAVVSLAPEPSTPEWVKIGSTVNITSDTAYVDFTLDNANYKRFKIIFTNAIPSQNGTYLCVRFSPDGGSTIRTSGYQPTSTYIMTGISPDYDQGNNTGYLGFTGGLFINNTGSSTLKTAVSETFGVYESRVAVASQVARNNSSPRGAGYYNSSTESHNLVRILYAGGNIRRGEFELWGSKG